MDQIFSVVFFRLYDRKLQSGEITFKETEISKAHFTKICTDRTFVPPQESVERLCITMKLTDEEAEMLLAAAESTRMLSEEE